MTPEYISDLDRRLAAHLEALAANDPESVVLATRATHPVGSKVWYVVGPLGKIYRVTEP